MSVKTGFRYRLLSVAFKFSPRYHLRYHGVACVARRGVSAGFLCVFSCTKPHGKRFLRKLIMALSGCPQKNLCFLKIESLSSDDGNGNENVTWKYKFISFVLLRDYFNSLNFYRNGSLRTQTYFRLSSLRSQATETANYPGTKLAGVAFKLRKKMKNSTSCPHVLQKT